MFRIVRNVGLLVGLCAPLLWASSGLQARGPKCSCSSEWIQTFRGNQRRAFYGTGYIPAQLKTRWRFKTRWIRDSRLRGYGGRKLLWRGTGWSGQAAVVGDRVWVGSVGGVLYCLNRHTGKQLWKFTAGLSIKSSVTYWNGRVYFGSRSNKLYCLDAKTGKLLWSHRTPGRNVDSTPLVWKGRLYWGGEDTYLYAMNPLNGKIHWRYKTMGSIESSPMVYGNKIYINSYDGHLHAVSLGSGKRVWRFRTGDDTDTSPTFHRGKIYFGSENGLVYAVDAQTGELVWKRKTNGGVWSTPTLVGRRLFVGSNDRRIYALDAETGRLLWKYKTSDGVWASLVHVSGRLLVGDWAGYLHVLRATDGQRITRRRIGVAFKADGNHIVSTASVVKGRVYIGSRDGHFYCFEGPRQPSARQRRRSRWWRKRYGQEREAIVLEPGPLPPAKVSSLGAITDASIRGRMAHFLASKDRYARLLIARSLRQKKAPKAAALALLPVVLKDGADHIRLEAVKAAMNYGREAAALVKPLLGDRDGRVRAAACDVLGRLGARSNKASIEKLLWDREAMVQVACARALFFLGDRSKARRSLRRFLFGGARYRRGRVRRARRFSCPTRASKYYLYRNSKGKIRRTPREKRHIMEALLALHKLGDSCGKKHLYSRWYGCNGDRMKGFCTIYSDWQGWMKRLAPLKMIPLAPAKKQLRLLRRYGLPRYKDNNLRAGAHELLLNRSNDPRRVPILLATLAREKYPMIRVLSARGLARVKGAKAIAALTKALSSDGNPDVRLEAARSLVKLQKAAAKAALQARLATERSPRTKAGLAMLLARLKDASAQTTLKAMLGSSSLSARCLAIQGRALDAAGRSQVQKLLKAPERFLRLCAIRALIAAKHKASLQGAVSHSDPAVALRAAFALLKP